MHSRLTIARSVGLFAALLLTISCSDSMEPRASRSVPPPLFSYSANGSALNQVIGSLNENGTRLGKGFDNGNPHIGDAIIATFVWLSSSTGNIVASVHDNLNDANFTPVGNAYTLVEFVHSGGISMATYVATGVHGFADPGAPGGPRLAVFADLSEPVTDGGVLLTTYGGVEDDFARALGSHNSASTSGTGSQTVDPGPIAVNAGALVYTVSLVPIAGLGGRALPDSVNYITTISDNSLVNDAGYRVLAGAGSVHAQWSYTFNSPSNALVTVLALNAAPSPTPANQPPTADFTSSCGGLTCAFTNTSTDPDGTVAGSSWTFGDGTTSTAQSPSHAFPGPGTYTVTLTVTDNQGAQSAPTSKTVTVAAPNQAPTANFTSSCSGLSCNFTSTSSDPDGTLAGYSWTFGDGTTSTAQNPSHTFAAGGTYTVSLTVTDNRGAQSAATAKTVTVTPPNSAPVVNAGVDQTVLLGVLYTQTVSFTDPDNGPWTYTIEWGDGSTSTGTRTSAGSFSVGHTYLGLSVLGTRVIRVTIRDSLGATGSDTKNLKIVLL